MLSRSPTSTTRAELEAFVEAPSAFSPPTPDSVQLTSRRFTLIGWPGGTWTAVQRIRLRDGEAPDAVEEVRAFMRETRTSLASWWVCERSTPIDVEAQLLGAGLRIVPGDYEIEGMLLTKAPPPSAPEVSARAVSSVEEYVEAHLVQYEAFGTPAGQRQDEATLAAGYEVDRRAGVVVLYAAWLDGRIAGAGRAIFAPCGVFLSGGATAPWARSRGVYRALVRARWDDAAARGTPALAVHAGAMSAPILRRLGFEAVCSFRRLQGEAS